MTHGHDDSGLEPGSRDIGRDSPPPADICPECRRTRTEHADWCSANDADPGRSN
jgi:hypothetical protein